MGVMVCPTVERVCASLRAWNSRSHPSSPRNRPKAFNLHNWVLQWSAASVKPVRTILRGLIDYGFRGANMSYSQYGEDIIVRFALDTLAIQHPRYIDIC